MIELWQKLYSSKLTKSLTTQINRCWHLIISTAALDYLSTSSTLDVRVNFDGHKWPVAAEA